MYCITSFVGSLHGKGEDQWVENICKNREYKKMYRIREQYSAMEPSGIGFAKRKIVYKVELAMYVHHPHLYCYHCYSNVMMLTNYP